MMRVTVGGGRGGVRPRRGHGPRVLPHLASYDGGGQRASAAGPLPGLLCVFSGWASGPGPRAALGGGWVAGGWAGMWGAQATSGWRVSTFPQATLQDAESWAVLCQLFLCLKVSPNILCGVRPAQGALGTVF